MLPEGEIVVLGLWRVPMGSWGFSHIIGVHGPLAPSPIAPPCTRTVTAVNVRWRFLRFARWSWCSSRSRRRDRSTQWQFAAPGFHCHVIPGRWLTSDPVINPLKCKCNDSATPNNMKLYTLAVDHLVQRGGTGRDKTVPITVLLYGPSLCGFNVSSRCRMITNECS